MKVVCLKCSKEFKKANSDIKRSPNHFCSKSCAGSYNNVKGQSPKRKPEGNCKSCGISLSKRWTYCKPCWQKKITPLDMSLEEATYYKHHKSSAYALVRARARAVAKKLGWSSCSNCGYDKHIEIAHIKAVSDFSEDTLVSVINSPSNLIPLCRNCHWEFDH